MRGKLFSNLSFTWAFMSLMIVFDCSARSCFMVIKSMVLMVVLVEQEDDKDWEATAMSMSTVILKFI